MLRIQLNKLADLIKTIPELMDLQWLARFSTVRWFRGLVRSIQQTFSTSVMGYNWFRTVVMVRFVLVLNPSFRVCVLGWSRSVFWAGPQFLGYKMSKIKFPGLGSFL